jgi:hypothetical protein
MIINSPQRTENTSQFYANGVDLQAWQLHALRVNQEVCDVYM